MTGKSVEHTTPQPITTKNHDRTRITHHHPHHHSARTALPRRISTVHTLDLILLSLCLQFLLRRLHPAAALDRSAPLHPLEQLQESLQSIKPSVRPSIHPSIQQFIHSSIYLFRRLAVNHSGCSCPASCLVLPHFPSGLLVTPSWQNNHLHHHYHHPERLGRRVTNPTTSCTNDAVQHQKTRRDHHIHDHDENNQVPDSLGLPFHPPFLVRLPRTRRISAVNFALL